MTEPAIRIDRKADRYTVHPHAAHRAVGGEIFIVTADRAFHRLSVPSAIDAFEAIVHGRGLREDLVTLLVHRYQVGAQQADDDIGAFLQTLVDRQILVRAQAGPCS